jgi:hypothetical protein
MDDINKNNKDKKVENKGDRLDRMEANMDLIKDGLLTLINMVEWNNETITPIGTHNREVEITHFETLEDAIKTYKNENPEDK